MQAVITFYYDTYELEFGDGFYPLLTKNNEDMKAIDIPFTFIVIDKSWRQDGGEPIYGLDGSTGERLLKLLNNKIEVNGLKIQSLMHRQLYPKPNNLYR